MCTNYNVDSNTKYSNYIELRINSLNYNRVRIKTSNYRHFELANS